MPISSVKFNSASDHGYANSGYAHSLQEFGEIRELPACGGWLLQRPIPHTTELDAMGCYPLFCCQDWSALDDDLKALTEDLVCIWLVTDPFGDVTLSQMQATLPSVCREYKQHYVTDLSLPLETTVRSQHRRNVRKALDCIHACESSLNDQLLSEWLPLYDNLVRRHRIEGIARFSPISFERQMQVPGFIAFSALDGDDTCGMALWYVRGDVAYYHLGAYSDRGYERGASFAIFWTALSHFKRLGIRWAALGAGAGAQPSESGLTRFKQNWATHTRPVYFCGRVLQPAVYHHLSANAPGQSAFFPQYRHP